MDQVHKVLRTLCRRVGTPLATKVLRHADAGEWIELQRLKVVPGDYADPFSYWADASCVDLLRKMALPGSGTAQAAVDKFLETERACHSVNRRMRSIQTNSGLSVSDMAYIDRLDRWKEKVRIVLGKVPEYLEPQFSGGSTTSTARLESTIFDKLSMTPERYGHSKWVMDTMFYDSRWGDVAHQRRLYPTEATGNQYFTVPKNGLTDRSCCQEAVVNLAYQLAVGQVIRRRAFKALNIDLNHGAALHQELARAGSLYGHVATLDLSSASDRWARELVRYLLPSDWRVLLDSLRATHTLFGARRLYLEKFSSMGNGFTFELETVLFATLALVVQEEELIAGEIHCYGDDLIVPVALGIPLAAALAQMGHSLNLDKSFLEGPFRESCGGDYHSGVAVSTAKLESLPEEPRDWMSLANNLRRVAGQCPRRWALIKPVWDQVLAFLPNQIRSCRGPDHLGDAVIHDSREKWTVRNGQVRGLFPVVAKRSLKYYEDYPTVIALGMIRSDDLRGRVPLRKVEGYRLRWVSPEDGSDWLPGTPIMRVDPRLTRLRFERASAQHLVS